MKKAIIFFIFILLFILSALIYKYKIFENEERMQKQLNEEIETFTEGEISGTSLITLINRIVDLNRKNEIQTDKDGIFIENDTNSIKIDVKFLEAEDVFPMERIEKLRIK